MSTCHFCELPAPKVFHAGFEHMDITWYVCEFHAVLIQDHFEDEHVAYRV